MALPSTGLVGWKIQEENRVGTCTSLESTKSQRGEGAECEEGAEPGLSRIFSWVFPIGAADLYQKNT